MLLIKQLSILLEFMLSSEDLDSKYVFADLRMAQDLLEYDKTQISGIEIKKKKGADESAIINQLNQIFKNKITVKNRAQLNESLIQNVEYGEYCGVFDIYLGDYYCAF